MRRVQRGSWHLGVCRALLEKEGRPPKLAWGRQVRLPPLQAPSTGGSVGSWGPEGPMWLPTPPPRPSHLPRENTTEAGHGSGLYSRGREACSRGLVSHWDPGLPFPRGPERQCSLSISESGFHKAQHHRPLAVTHMHAHVWWTGNLRGITAQVNRSTHSTGESDSAL